VGPRAFVLTFRRDGFEFRAGQHATLSLPGQGERDYSVYSGVDDPQLEFLVREVEGGQVSPPLGRLSAGAEVEIVGPGGVMVLDPRWVGRSPCLFLATGTGVAPFHAMTRSHPGLDWRLVHGVRHDDERYEAAHYPADRLVSCVTQGTDPSTFRGRVTNWLRTATLRPGTRCFLCGNARMIEEATDLLLERGVPPSHVMSEVYF
jgi:ferredoxin--NADP+ reductase/benzoate/toluate 1,2-dioxygenase reductase subunit